MHDIGAIAPRLQVETQLGQSRIEFQVGLAERGLGRQPDLERGRFVLADRGHLDFGAQRLSERGLHVQATQAGRVRAAGRHRQAQSDSD